MTAERVTVSLPGTLLQDAREAVDAGQAPNLSAFVADALQARLTRARGLSELEQVLGGRPPREELNAVRRTLGLPPTATA